MRFSPVQATSIDLHIHETVRWSAYRDRITVFAEEVEKPFTDVAVRFWPKDAATPQVSRLVAESAPTLIVVHQHLPTATALVKACPGVPVVLVRHNFQKPPRNVVSRLLKQHQFNRLAGIGFVSECCKEDFAQVWPGVRTPTHVVLNGIDGSLWQPAARKDPIVLFVGRMAPEKGALEAAEAMASTLCGTGGAEWRGIFITTDAAEHADYARQVRSVIGKAQGRIELLSNLCHDDVRHWMGRASISLAPTQNREPFGRVAIEALASGTALIASARGGFKEIVGEAGVLLDHPTADNIATALHRLMADGNECARLSEAGRNRVIPRYDLSRAAATFDALAKPLLPVLP